MSTTRSALMVIAASLLWGTTGTIAHLIGGAISPLAIGAVTMGVGGLILAAMSWPGTRSILLDTNARRWAIWGGVGVVVYPLGFYTGMDLAGVAVGNILALGTGPIVGALLEWRLDRKKPTTGWWVATITGVNGVILISTSNHSGTTADAELFGVGVAVALLAGVGYGIFSYAMGRIIDAGHSPLASAGATFGVGSIPLLVIVAVSAPAIIAAPESWIGLSYLVLGPMVISYVLYSRAMKKLSSSSVLTIALTEPAVATLLAVWLVGERFDLTGALGIVLIALAVIGATRSAAERNNPPSI